VAVEELAESGTARPTHGSGNGGGRRGHSPLAKLPSRRWQPKTKKHGIRGLKITSVGQYKDRPDTLPVKFSLPMPTQCWKFSLA